MNEYKFNEIVEFFGTECECDERIARKFAGYVDNIVFNARMENNNSFIYMVAYGVRNAYWEGQAGAEMFFMDNADE